MLKRKRKTLVTLAIVFGLGVTVLAYAAYASASVTACALAKFAELEALPDGTLVEQSSSVVERATFIELQSQARVRIKETFGAPRAEPLVVFRDSRTFWPLKLNNYASAAFLGSRVCVLIGPQGQNVDIVAHEFMHAELANRVGHWRRFFDVPAWFEEGVAMQVDLRARYNWSDQQDKSKGYGYVRQLNSQSKFNDADDKQLTRNYAAAKAEVAQWLTTIGRGELYNRFERIRAGENFEAVLTK